ncbi:MAG: MBL fold metallo-hydrolase [Steroidobacteraceae bacterium]|jgi:glyoxylase-like metal-dependent hydrolase (beta-lactamase superfamily II)
MQVAVVPVTPFQQNCSVLWCERTRRAAIVDPGGDLERVLPVLEQEGLQLERILLTHAHLDHAAATAELARRTGVPVEGPHPGDRFWIEQLPEQARMFGFGVGEVFEPDRWLDQGDVVRVGELELAVHHCPGHTPGHVVFFHEPGRFAFVGDVLFAGSIGRTDFPGGNHAQLLSSIRERLFPLGDDVTFLPGHGPTSTFGEERRSNPFVADELFRR